MLLYLDTSAIVKRYKTEAGTEFIEEAFNLIITHHTRFTTSSLTTIEAVSGLKGLLKQKAITPKEFDDAVSRFFHDLHEYFAVQTISERIILLGTEKVIIHGLKAGDAIQLATALEVSEKVVTVFIAADQSLCKVALQEGLKVVNPVEKGALRKLQRWIGV